MDLKKSQLYSSLWQSCDELRGGMDASQYKDYVLTLLFMKYVSDKHAGKPDALIEVPAGGGFADMVKLKGDKEIGHEYIRHGTLSLLAGIDLLSGEVLGLVRPRHRSAEFIEFLKLADGHYPAGARIRLVLDNHSAHISKQTRAFLATLPNRFEFTFTPKHGSWLNLIESFFGKMAKTLLRGIRVASADELKTRIELYLKEVNETPVVFRWKYKLETLSLV